MRETLIHLHDRQGKSIQAHLREKLVDAILGGQIPPDSPLPSSRKLAKSLGISRNTVVLAYQGLVDDGYLLTRERSGFYVNPDILEASQSVTRMSVQKPEQWEPSPDAPDWQARFRLNPSGQPNITKPKNWLDYPYPFTYGQVDHQLFPIAAWRECSRQALGRKAMDAWTGDAHSVDDADLVHQIRTRLLPRRGILARDDEILITLGSQNAIYLLSTLLTTDKSVVGFEDPGYRDAWNIFSLRTKNMRAIPVDASGLPVDERLDECDYVFVTPSHQSPTTVTLPITRRRALLEKAREADFVIIEDDYEFESSYLKEPTPALKSMDRDGRVIYVGSLSKSLFPGLRLGFMVAPAPLIAEARALRRLILRHPPANNQHTAALFLSLGHHDALLSRLHRTNRNRWEQMRAALDRHLPQSTQAPTFGGTSFWVRGPDWLDTKQLATTALEHGLILEPGEISFFRPDPPKNFFRLGFSSIAPEKIEPGIHLLAKLIDTAQP